MCADRTSQQTPRSKPAEGHGFGEPLRRAREARGLTLEAVAEKTRIASRHLDALERGDLEALPSGPFGRSYIRSYAEVLGIDPAPILRAYHVQEIRRGVGTPERDQRMLQELSHLVGRGSQPGGALARLRARPAMVAAAAVFVAVLGTIGWLLARSGARSRPAQVAPQAAATAPPPAPPPAPVSLPESAPSSRADRLTRSPGGGVAPGRPRPAQPPVSKLSTDTLQVSEFGVGTGVVDHRLVGKADGFPEGTRVSFWTLVVGGQPGHVVRHVWFQAGRPVMRADLPVGGPHWRTRSSLVLPDGSSGPWTVEARTSDGRLLARNDFICEARAR